MADYAESVGVGRAGRLNGVGAGDTLPLRHGLRRLAHARMDHPASLGRSQAHRTAWCSHHHHRRHSRAHGEQCLFPVGLLHACTVRRAGTRLSSCSHRDVCIQLRCIQTSVRVQAVETDLTTHCILARSFVLVCWRVTGVYPDGRSRASGGGLRRSLESARHGGVFRVLCAGRRVRDPWSAEAVPSIGVLRKTT